MANESRLDLVDGRRPHPVAGCVSAVPLSWLAMFRLADLSSRSLRFTTDVNLAVSRLRDSHGLRSMFGAYGDASQYMAMLADTLADHVRARGTAGVAPRVSIDIGEIAGEHPDPRAWARALGAALDALDSRGATAAPLARPTTTAAALTEVDKIRWLRSAADLGIGDARALLHDHDGDLHAALAAIDAEKSPEQRARDLAGAFTARLVNPQQLPDRPPWQVLLEASGLEYGVPFPPADLLLRPHPLSASDLRTHARLLGESVTSGAVSWEPDHRP